MFFWGPRILPWPPWEVVAVVTAPDRQAGRGQKLKKSAVKEFAEKNGLPVLQPTNLKAPGFIEELKSYQANLQVVVAFRMLPEVVWKMPRLGTINLHASLLPQYRGAAPINWAIIQGEQETGITTFFLKQQIDTGDILMQEKVAIDTRETVGSLHDKLMIRGARLLSESVAKISSGNYQTVSQQELTQAGAVKEAPKLNKENTRIPWQAEVNSIDRLVRGLSPYPAAWTFIEDQSGKKLLVKVYEAIPEEDGHNHSGTIKQEGKELRIGAADGWMKIRELQLQGKKRMKTTDLLNGFNFAPYSISDDA